MTAEIERHLDRIATVLEHMFPADGPGDVPAICLHPAEKRIDFGLTGGVEDWQCKLCSYRTVPQSAEGVNDRG